VPPGGRHEVVEEGNGRRAVAVLEKPIGPREIAAVIEGFPVEELPPEERDVANRPEREGTMLQEQVSAAARDYDGFLKTLSSWTPATAEALAREHDIGPLTDDHWRVIEFVREYYKAYGKGPPVVKIHKHTGLTSEQICNLFPCGMVKGAYRLAGLPRPPGCA
jgi:tRNA 2-thiouridine synthesizing protein E